ncbi:MAG: PAS domain S-box protein [Chloroflexi bacterium]|nr:PAS domain S-box protein [Chloroflexota bacterium]
MKTSKTRTKKKVWQKADARILGQILAAQNVDFVLPDSTHIADFFAETLIAIPGIKACRVCLHEASAQRGEMEIKVCEACKASREKTGAHEEIHAFEPGFKCGLAGLPGMEFSLIASSFHHFGFFVLQVDEVDTFNIYKPFIDNLANYVALSLENRRQRDLLQKAYDELERRVEERTEELRASNEMIQDIYNNAPCGYHSLDKDGFFILINDTELRWLGYSREEIVGRVKFRDLLTANSLKTFEVNFPGFKERGWVSGLEFDLVCKDGSILPVLLNATAVTDRDGGYIMSRSTIFDITERRKAEEALRKSEAELRAFFSQSIDGCFYMMLDEPVRWDETVDKEQTLDYVFSHQRITQINDAMLVQYGATREQMLNLTPNDLFQHNIEHGRSLWRRFFDTGKLVLESDERKMDGTPIWIEGEYIALYDPQGRILGHFGVQRDITERKQAEMALQRLNRELRAISNCNQALLRAVDEQTLLNDICRIICDEAGYRMAWVGYPQRDQILGGHPVACAGAEDGYLAAADIVTRSTPQRELGTNEIVIWNGVTTYVYDFATDPEAAPWREIALQHGFRSKVGLPLKDEDASTFGVLHIYSAEPNAFTSDEIRLLEELAGDLAFGITALRTRAERKQAEMALRESETRFRAVFENSVDAIGVSKAGIHVFVNPAYLALFGYADNAELMGKPILDLIAPSQHKQILENVRQRADGQPTPAAYETRGLRKDSSEFDMDVHVSTYELNDEVYTVAHLRDITERKQAEKALRESEERLRQIASSLREVIWLRDAQTRQVLYVNPAFQELTGRTCESFYENRDVVMDAIHPDDREAVVKALAQRSENVHYDKEHRIIHLDGSVHWVSSRSFPVRNEAGEVYRWATIMEDITERKRNERELTILNRAINQSSDAVFLIDEQLIFAYVNDAACRSLGYTREELLTMRPSDIDAVITYDAAENIMNQQFANGHYPRFETLHKTRDGRIFPVEISSSVVEYDDAKFSLTTARDITERKKAEDALHEREKHSQSLLRLSRDLERAQTYPEVLDAARNEVKSIVGYQNLWAYLFTEDKRHAHAIFAGGPLEKVVMSKDGMATLTVQGDRMLEEIIEAKEIVVVEDAQIDDRVNREIVQMLGNRTIVNVPIVLFDRHLGSVGTGTFGTEGVRIPTASEREYLIALASHMAVTLDRIHLLDKRRQAELSLRENEEKFRTLIEQSAEGVMLADENGNIVEWNHAYERITGLKQDQALGQPLWDIMVKMIVPERVTMERYESIKAGILEALHTGKSPLFAAPTELEFHPISSGEKRYLHQIIFPIKTEKGYRVASLVEDITERKRAEEELQRTNDLLNVIIEAAPTAIIGLDLDGKVQNVWNSAAEKLLGWSAEEVMGKFLPSVPVDKEEEFRRFREWIHSGKSLNGVEVQRQKRDGTPIDYSIYASPLHDVEGQIIGNVAVLVDITERKRMIEALAAQEREFRTLAENSPDNIARYDVNCRTLYINPALEKTLGRTASEMLGTTAMEAAIIDESGRYQEKIAEVLESGKDDEMDLILPDREGGVRYHNVRFVAERGADGVVTGVQTIGRDVTERKQAEEEIRQLNQNLEQRVIDRTAQLEAANKELEAFAYSVSHDLRAPLRHIDGFIDMLRDRMGAGLDDQSLHYMDVIADAARKMGTLIDDLLSFSRMGRNEMSKAQVDLDELVQEVIQEFKHEIEGRNVQWKVSALPVVSGDRAMLRIVLVNLIANALKFTRSRETTQIEIGCEKNDEGETVVFVRDNGVGFDMTYTDKLFGVFQRLHHQDDFEGTGIGLANVRRIISRHGGRTWAEGEVDQGATFYFSLPTLKQE